ncbi:MAG: hypothetical protein AYK19_10125 [Theionarchaea archaeon DG-70-1]|nr:MAG: hypothetical protein AYK19_10125 [Theionarchaea archaeon DG-70-1]
MRLFAGNLFFNFFFVYIVWIFESLIIKVIVLILKGLFKRVLILLLLEMNRHDETKEQYREALERMR